MGYMELGHKTYGDCCEWFGCGWNASKCEVHHIDYQAHQAQEEAIRIKLNSPHYQLPKNNKSENLSVLCPNHHTFVHEKDLGMDVLQYLPPRIAEQARQYLLQKDHEDQRDYLYGVANAAALPASVDLRPMFGDTAIYDQGHLGSCTANAICMLKIFWDRSYHGAVFNLSRLFLYWKERELINATSYDSGAFIRDGFKVMQKVGVSGESFFPYVQNNYTQAPTPEAVENAAIHKFTEYYRITGVAQLKQSLADGKPVVFGMDVFESFESEAVAKSGMVPMPKPGEQNMGGHAVLAVGYKDGHIIVRNSWGADWGDNGHFYLPEEYFTGHVLDMWSGH